MANEAINPFQQFLQFAGLPNANGQIEFFTDSGKGTQKDIFSDSDLTVAQSNPYTLDDSGRIIGDVHYEGTATLVHTDVDGYEFRQDDDVVVTSDGDTSAITINHESVAAMVTDDGLEVGDIVKTHGYYSGNNYGGARYLIVAGGTSTADGFRFHNLGNGLQAKLLDVARNNNFLVAGAKGDGGTDDSIPMQSVINRGGDVIVEGGFIFVGSALSISKNIRFIGFGTIKQDNAAGGDLLQITSREVRSVKFRDVTLDGNQINGNSTNATVGWALS